MAETQPCPNDLQLQALIDGELPEAESDALAAHLDACDECRRRLESLVGRSDVIPRDATAMSHSPGESEALAEAMRQLKTAAADETRTEAGSSVGPPSLGFLTPSANPRHLGRLSDYEIVEVIGRGGMGTVLKARDAKLERLVAVKVLNPELASSGPARARFLREARSAAAVTHEHVVTIHAVDEANDVPFLVMEYVLGVSLEDRIQKSGHLRVEEILRIGMQAASGLAAAHAQGLVHRDIKPSNILLENGVERVKITDFGLARVMHEAQLTQTNAVAGTPQYMSPEQARGEPVDHRSDLFSLGCVMYAMCVGRSPFRAETPTGAIHRVCEDTPRPIREINPEVPDWLVAIIDRLLAKSPEERFQTAAEVAETLGEYLAHVQQPSRVRLPSRRVLPARPRGGLLGLRRRKLAAAALAVCVGLVVLGSIELAGIISPWDREKDAPPPPPPNFHFVDLRPQATRALSEDLVVDTPGNNLAELRPGVLQVDGVPLDVADRYVQLSGGKTPSCPDAVRGIEVNRKAAKLDFLHGTTFGYPWHGVEVASYTVHYDDGTSETMPVVTGRHLRDWWFGGQYPELATRAKRAWTGSNPYAATKDRRLQLFLCSWENPHPEKTITTIDFERGRFEWPAPFCLAITCDDDPGPLPPERGLVAVSIGEWARSANCLVTIAGSPDPPIKGRGTHHLLLPPGRHPVEIRDGQTVIRRGSIEVEAGARVNVSIDAPQDLFALPVAQPRPTHELVGQSWGIWDLTLSSEGNVLATAAGDGSVIVWRRKGTTWKKETVLSAHDNRVRSVAFSPSGDVLATAGEDGRVKLWYVASGQLVATLGEDGNKVYAVAFSPDGRTLVSGNGDGTLDVWDAKTHAKIASVTAYANMVVVHDLAFSPDGSLLATGVWGENENAVKLWGTATWQPKHVMRGHTSSVMAVAFSPDGKMLASAGEDSTVKLWNVETGELVHSFTHPKCLVAVAFDPEGKKLAAGGAFETVRVWDVASYSVLSDFQAHWDVIRALAFMPDGKSLVTAGSDNSTRFWSLADLPGPFENEVAGPEPRAVFSVHEDWSECAAFSSQACGLIAAVDIVASDLHVWDLKDFSQAARFSVKGNDDGYMVSHSLVFSPKDDSLITCLSREGKPLIGVWDSKKQLQLDTFEPASIPKGKGISGATMALSADGAALAVASRGEGVVSMIDLPTRTTRWLCLSENRRLKSLAVSPDGRLLALGTDPGLVVLLDAQTGKEIHGPLQHGNKKVNAVAISSQAVLASAGDDAAVRLWDLASFEGVALPKAHREKVYCAAFSPDGRLLVTAGGASMFEKAPWDHNGEVCLWDVTARKLVAKFFAHYGSVTSAVFSPDGKSLATTGRDGKMNLWDVDQLLKWASEAESPKEPTVGSDQ